MTCSCGLTRVYVRRRNNTHKPWLLCIFKGDKAGFQNFKYEYFAAAKGEEKIQDCIYGHTNEDAFIR